MISSHLELEADLRLPLSSRELKDLLLVIHGGLLAVFNLSEAVNIADHWILCYHLQGSLQS